MSKNLSEIPKTAAIVERLQWLAPTKKAKTMVKDTMPGIARSSGQKYQFAPYYRYEDTS